MFAIYRSVIIIYIYKNYYVISRIKAFNLDEMGLSLQSNDTKR